MVGVIASVVAFVNSAYDGDVIVEARAACDYFKGVFFARVAI